jgi:hypothetical protein
MKTDDQIYFTVSFNKKGVVIKVEKDGVVIPPKTISGKSPTSFDKIDFFAVTHKEGSSPCCFITPLGTKYCWC